MDFRKLAFGDEPLDIRKRWHHMRRSIRRIRTWQLVIVFILMFLVSATFLRLNNIKMLELRDAVTAADKEGNAEQLYQATSRLREFVIGHMNTSLGRGVALQHTYDRAVDKVLNASASTSEVDNKSLVYQEAAKAECQSRFRGGVASFRNDYVQCVVEKVSQLAPSASLDAKLPNVNLYYYNFASPSWSPDLAGFSLLITAVIGLAIIARLVFDSLARIILSRSKRRLQ